jgi:Competence protein CoiA-like family
MPEEKHVADLYVPGLDLCTGQVVQADERPVWEWREKGHNGDGTLVCLECYQGADRPDGPRPVPLVPRGRVGGIRRPHFAHPAGMGPPGGHHNPETAWHWDAKQRLCRWAAAAGAAVRVEAWTADKRRRSDVSVTLPGGARLAIEVQCGRITDAEVLARREDYARAGIGVVWVWHPATGVPHVLYQFGEPGWEFDLTVGRMGLACGTAHRTRAGGDHGAAYTRGPHWPPCPGDEIEIRWMPLAEVRLTAAGLLPSPQILVRLEEEAAQAEQRARAQREFSAARSRPRGGPPHRQKGSFPGSRSTAKRSPRPHLAQRIDALPPWDDPSERMYWCARCGYMSGAELQSSPTFHEIPGPNRIITQADLATGPDP